MKVGKGREKGAEGADWKVVSAQGWQEKEKKTTPGTAKESTG